jgi:hypothetical protein
MQHLSLSMILALACLLSFIFLLWLGPAGAQPRYLASFHSNSDTNILCRCLWTLAPALSIPLPHFVPFSFSHLKTSGLLQCSIRTYCVRFPLLPMHFDAPQALYLPTYILTIPSISDNHWASLGRLGVSLLLRRIMTGRFTH